MKNNERFKREVPTTKTEIMTAKEQAIKEAYGEHWETVKDYVDENGWTKDTNRARFSSLEFHKTKDLMRPLSLKGIETNNGWIKIESEDNLPKDVNGLYHLTNIDASNFLPSEDFFKVEKFWKIGLITHYQPITKPQPPIY